MKLWKYQAAGVRECWLVDIEKNRVVVYTMEEDIPLSTVYTFDDIIPIGIFEQQCKINMKEVYAEVAFLDQLHEIKHD